MTDEIPPVEPGFQRYFASMYAVDHRIGDPDDVVRIWSITERGVAPVREQYWTPELLERLRRQRED